MFRSDQSVAAQEYWQALPKKDGTIIPYRKDINPADLKDILPNVVIAEVIPEGPSIIVRLAGTALRDLVGLEITGVDAIELLPEDVMEGSLKGMLELHDYGIGIWQIQPVEYRKGVEYCLEMTFLPIWGEGDKRYLFGVILSAALSDRFDRESHGTTLMSPKESVWIDIGNGVLDW